LLDYYVIRMVILRAFQKRNNIQGVPFKKTIFMCVSQKQCPIEKQLFRLLDSTQKVAVEYIFPN